MQAKVVAPLMQPIAQLNRLDHVHRKSLNTVMMTQYDAIPSYHARGRVSHYAHLGDKSIVMSHQKFVVQWEMWKHFYCTEEEDHEGDKTKRPPLTGGA